MLCFDRQISILLKLENNSNISNKNVALKVTLITSNINVSAKNILLSFDMHNLALKAQ